MSFFGSHASIDCPHIRMYASIAYLMNFPNVMLITDIIMFALISPRHMVMALPSIGTKAKNPIHAPCPPMNLVALSKLSLLTCRYLSIQSSLPILPTP